MEKTRKNRMQKGKWVSVLLIAALAAVLLGGCGSFDASGYVKALLDNSYLGDSNAFVNQKVGTKEQAEELYEQGIETEMSSLTSQIQLSEELQEEFRAVLKEVFKNVKYTVGEAKKNGDTYEVEVKYQKMNIFATALESFNTKSEEYMAEMTEKATNGEETPSDSEVNEEVFRLLKEAIQDSLANASFAEEASTIIHIELKNNTWTPNEDDVYQLEQLLFDIEEMSQV